MRNCLLPSLLALSFNCAAAPDFSQTGHRAAQFAQDRVDDIGRMLEGPARPAVPAVPPVLSCNELYERKLALQRAQLGVRPAYGDDPRNAVAMAVGTINPWGFAFLPLSGMQSYLESARSGQLDAELDALRFASARQRCFVR